MRGEKEGKVVRTQGSKEDKTWWSLVQLHHPINHQPPPPCSRSETRSRIHMEEGMMRRRDTREGMVVSPPPLQPTSWLIRLIMHHHPCCRYSPTPLLHNLTHHQFSPLISHHQHHPASNLLSLFLCFSSPI